LKTTTAGPPEASLEKQAEEMTLSKDNISAMRVGVSFSTRWSLVSGAPEASLPDISIDEYQAKEEHLV
jgi:hypothetical protein